jgi:hypothetical protein
LRDGNWKTKIDIYLIFVGITVQIDEVKNHLKAEDHTLLEGSSVWNKLELNAQVVIMLKHDDALVFKKYLDTDLQRLEVPI